MAADTIGGAISDILGQSARSAATADATATAVADSHQLAAAVQDEVDGITARLEAAFRDLSVRLQDTVRQTSDQLHAAQWQGSSREALVAFDQDLAARAAGFLQSTEEGVAGFRGQLMAAITDFYDSVRTDFTTAMTEIETRYGDAARAAETYAHNLEDLDRTAITY